MAFNILFGFIFSVCIYQLPEKENNNKGQNGNSPILFDCGLPQRLNFKIKSICFKGLGKSRRGALFHFEEQRF